MIEERRKLVLTQETEEDAVVSLSLRPARIEDFVGQADLIENLKVSLQAARKRKEPIEHMLFSGPPGFTRPVHGSSSGANQRCGSTPRQSRRCSRSLHFASEANLLLELRP